MDFGRGAGARTSVVMPSSRGGTSGRRVLVSTIATDRGGVAAMNRFIIACLRERDYQPVPGFYEPYSVAPELSVPFFRLFQRSVGTRRRSWMEQSEAHAIGAWLPELEFTHYLATRHWRKLIASCDHHIVVSGNALPATALVQLNRPHLSWVATGWEEDRKDRVSGFPWPRRVLDRFVNAPVLRRLEKSVIRRGRTLALSEYTRKALDGLAGRSVVRGVLPMPVETAIFQPRPGGVAPGRIGFSGRLNDPRKNIGLLLEATARLAARGVDVSLDLIGSEPDAWLEAALDRLQLRERVSCLAYMPKERLAARLATLDVFVVPSHQEGLCIAALEAMACGCPVVSTRCGGPEEFVRDGETGFLVESDPEVLAAAIARIVEDRALRDRVSDGARRLVEQRYAPKSASAIFWDHFETVCLSSRSGS